MSIKGETKYTVDWWLVKSTSKDIQSNFTLLWFKNSYGNIQFTVGVKWFKDGKYGGFQFSMVGNERYKLEYDKAGNGHWKN